MIFTSILKSKENDQLSKLNHSWILADALAEFNRKQCIKAYELCVEACTLYDNKGEWYKGSLLLTITYNN